MLDLFKHQLDPFLLFLQYFSIFFFLNRYIYCCLLTLLSCELGYPRCACRQFSSAESKQAISLFSRSIPVDFLRSFPAALAAHATLREALREDLSKSGPARGRGHSYPDRHRYNQPVARESFGSFSSFLT